MEICWRRAIDRAASVLPQPTAGAAENVEHTLQAAIIDSTGAVLIEAAPVKFFAHRATVRR